MPEPLSDRSMSILEALRRHGEPVSRTDLAAELGVARATLTEGLAELESRSLIRESATIASTGGRPPQTFELNPTGATIAVIDVGGSRTRVGIADFTGTLMADALLREHVEAGPETILGWALNALEAMLEEHHREPEGLLVVVGLPGPVDFVTGEVVSPPIMSNWRGYDVRSAVTDRMHAPVIIENDVNLIALAEQRLDHPDAHVMLVIKLGTGIGGGLVINGHLLRGARGAAGDIGHTQATRAHGAQCRCGHVGCVEAIAGGWALVQTLQSRGVDVTDITDVARLVREGEPTVTGHVRAATRVVGQAVAQAVSLLNPDTVVIAGEMLAAGDSVLATIREGVYQYSLPLATHDLRLVPSGLGDLVGLKGGAQLGIDVLVGAAYMPQLDLHSPVA